ncbi:ATP-binding protein [Streptacidiphilus neutrinimicus]|uniref:ATP-binding protein n=1 Tax=Streptacidiphilus neutrinimicus TaxID=105420 RepID=UPI0005A7A1DD|nr:ATP-binding protein [Streptacidiphilus neutrinimicus]
MSAPETDRPVVPAQQVRRLSLREVRRPVGRARDFIREVLADWHWRADDAAGDEAVEDVLLVVSELVANASSHGGGAAEIAVVINGLRLTVSVADAESRLPRVRPVEPSQPGGHGLHVVELLATVWGTTPGPHGKTVWATF